MNNNMEIKNEVKMKKKNSFIWVNILLFIWMILIIVGALSVLKPEECAARTFWEQRDYYMTEVIRCLSWFVIGLDIIALFGITNYNLMVNNQTPKETIILLSLPFYILLFSLLLA